MKRRGVNGRPSEVTEPVLTWRLVGEGVRGLGAGEEMDEAREDGRSEE